MALDITAITRLTGGEYFEHSLPETTPIDSVVPLGKLVVRGHSKFATLVTAPIEDLEAVLPLPSAETHPLRNAVFITHSADEVTRELVIRNRLNAILGADVVENSLLSQLQVFILSDQGADDRLVASAMKVLTQVARRGGASAVVVELAHRIDGWAVLLDADGHEITSASAGRLHIQDAISVALNRPVRVRHGGLQVHPVGESDLLGYLVIASRSASTSRNRDLASQAAALLDLIMRTHDFSVTERLGRELLIDSLLLGGAPASSILRRWGIHDSSLTGFTIGTRSRSIDLESMVMRWLDEIGATHLVTMRRERAIGFVRNDLAQELALRIKSFVQNQVVLVTIGFGRPSPVENLAATSAESEQAQESLGDGSESVAHYDQLPTVEFVLEQLGSKDKIRLASVLDGLRTPAAEKDQLLGTLTAYLLANGSMRATAAKLNIHRQTLSNRLRKISTLTHLDLERVDDRSTAWLAIRSLDFDA